MDETSNSITYRDLEIYKIAHRLAVDIHHLSLRLPKYELYETGNQLRRSSKSVSANIVEGFGRRKYNEIIEWVEYVRDCYPDFKEAIREIMGRLDELGWKLNSFIRAVERSHKS